MSALEQLENSLNDVFGKSAPPLPAGAKKFLVQILPAVNILLALLSFWAAWALWDWAHLANTLVNYANSVNAALGGTVVATNRLTVGIWLGILVLILEGVLYFLAFQGTQARKKVGWNYMFYALLVNLVYGILIVFISYGTFGNLLGYVIGSIVGLYFLFQIRGSYLGKKA